MPSNQNGQSDFRLIPAIWVVWFVAALVGDEIVGLFFVGFRSFGLVLNQPWWWTYQGTILAAAITATILIGVWRGLARMMSSGSRGSSRRSRIRGGGGGGPSSRSGR